MKFCDDCGTLLDINTKSGELKFICPQCFSEQPADPADTLMGIFMANDTQDSTYLKTIIKNAPYVPCIERLYFNCPECHNNILSFIRMKDTLSRVIICKCGYYQGAKN